jgi:hypothetical protein
LRTLREKGTQIIMMVMMSDDKLRRGRRQEGCVSLRTHTRHSQGIFAPLAPLRALREKGTQMETEEKAAAPLTAQPARLSLLLIF